MTELLNTFLTLILNYGYPVLLLCIVLSYLGIPISLNALLLAAGAFSVDGTLNIFLLFPLITITVILGDIFGYYLGKGFIHKFVINRSRLGVIEIYFRKWGWWSIFLTRWLLTPACIPINIVAGMSNYSFRKFLIAVVTGETIWSVLYLSLGYYFGANWILLWNYISDTPQILLIFIIGLGLIFYSLKQKFHLRESDFSR